MATAATPVIHTSARETHSARHTSRSAAARSGSAARIRRRGTTPGTGAGIGSRSMRIPDVSITAQSFVDRYDNEITAAVSIVLALIAAFIVDRAFARAEKVAAEAASEGRPSAVSPVAATR